MAPTFESQGTAPAPVVTWADRFKTGPVGAGSGKQLQARTEVRACRCRALAGGGNRPGIRSPQRWGSRLAHSTQ